MPRGENLFKHGYLGKHTDPTLRVTYQAWLSIIARTENPNYKGYKNYGGRGIKMCQKWRESFESFLADIGLRPSGDHSIDRIDNNKDYEPGNVRWATACQQARNQSKTARLEYNGEVVTLYDLADRVRIPQRVIYDRIKRGWPVARALETPLHSREKVSS